MSSEQSSNDQRLDQIETQWSLLRLAHQPISVANTQARQRVLLKYNRAIRAYTGALLQDENDADEVAQDVLIKLLQGNFSGADPSKGRFRDFLKVAVKNTVRSFWSQKQRRSALSLDQNQFAEPISGEESVLDPTWKNTLLELAMSGLEKFEQSHTGCHYFTILKLRTSSPEASSAELAELASKQLGKSISAEVIRQQLRRGRLRLAQMLVEEVAQSLNQPTPDAVEQELIELGLMDYVRPFLPDDWRETGLLKGEADL